MWGFDARRTASLCAANADNSIASAIYSHSISKHTITHTKHFEDTKCSVIIPLLAKALIGWFVGGARAAYIYSVWREMHMYVYATAFGTSAYFIFNSSTR